MGSLNTKPRYNLNTIIQNRLWSDLSQRLKDDSLSEAEQRRAIEAASKHCAESIFLSLISPHCTSNQLHSALPHLVSRGLWRAVDVVIERIQGTLRRVTKRRMSSKINLRYSAGEYGIDDVVALEILPHCDDDKLDYLVSILVKRHLWWCVVSVLERGVSDRKKRWVVQKALEDVKKGLFNFKEDYNKKYGSFINIVPHCADYQMDDVLEALVKKRQWYNVGEALKREVSSSVKQWAVEMACTHYENNEDVDDDDDSDYDGSCSTGGSNWSSTEYIDEYIINQIVPHCAAAQLGTVVAVLVKRDLLRAVEGVFQKVQGTTRRVNKRRLPSELSFFYYPYECGIDDIVTLEILPSCDDDMLDSLVSILVKRHLWCSAVRVLERDLSDCKKRWVVQKAREDIERGLFDEDFSERDSSFINIVAHCADDQMDDVLEALVKGRQWYNVREALKREVSSSVKRRAVEMACAHYENDDDDGVDDNDDHDTDGSCSSLKTTFGETGYIDEFIINEILPHCATDQLDTVLTTLVRRNLWMTALKVLERGVSESKERLALMAACKTCDDLFLKIMLSHCTKDTLQFVLPTLAEKNKVDSVRYVLKQDYRDKEHRKNMMAVLERANAFFLETILPSYVYGDVRSELGTLASRRFWKVFLMLLHRFTIDTLHSWAIAKDGPEANENTLWAMVSNPCEGVKELSPAQWRLVTWSHLQYCLEECLQWNTLLCEVLCEALLATVKEIWLSGREKEVECRSYGAAQEARSVTEDIHQQLIQTLIDCKYSDISALLPCIRHLCQKDADKTQSMIRQEPPARGASKRPGGPAENSGDCTRFRTRNPGGMIEEDQYGENGSSSSPLFQLHFLKYLTHEFYKCKAWTQIIDAILLVLSTAPVVPGIQSVALRIMVREKRWDVIRHACLSYVCEQDRRQVFQAAVKQREWGAVKRWADYSLYDDQRLWALGEAKEEKRWDVYLKLAGHGLSEGERMGVLYRVAMYADWKLVRHMVNTVADVAHMKDLLTNKRTARQSRPKPEMCHQRIEQLTEFEEALKKDTNTLKTLKTAAKRGKWQVVLYNIRHKPDLQNARRALKAAVSSEAWQTVIQLVRLETDVTRRDSLFRDMVRLRQWDVCRELLDQGVSDDLCVEALNDLVKHRQWTLVAMVMKCPMSEKRRIEMMYRALMMREGSVVWQCIKSLDSPLTSEQRENIFQLAFKREVWQAVKPLIEEKDETGISHRDTALLEAIEQHQWDVVDHCQRHHADINMKDDDGHTPIHRAARKNDWEAVKELTVRDGDPNLLDSEGWSVLHRAIRAQQWDIVKLLIRFHGDIHRPIRCDKKQTGLNMLIDARQIDVIESTFMWCADQWKGVNDRGETTLHAACLSGCPDILHDLIARRVDPLAVTSEGLSALCYAALCRDCPQKVVAECIKLGFSTHQPHITGVVERHSSQSHSPKAKIDILLTCPLMLAVMRGLPVVTQMLHESGACSNRWFFNLSAYLDSLTKSVPTEEFNSLWRQVHGNYDSDCVSDTVLKSADFLRQMSRTPRSLKSTCRLVIFHRLSLSKTRHRDIALLPLLPKYKDYLMFSDLTNPDFMGHQV